MTPSPSPRRARSVLIVGFVVAVCAVAIVLLVYRGPEAGSWGSGAKAGGRASSSDEQEGSAEQRYGGAASEASSRSGKRPFGQDRAAAGANPLQEMVAASGEPQPGAPPVAFDLIERFAEAHAKHEREWRQYPRNSHALAPGGADPVWDARRVTRRERFSSDGHSVGFTFYLSTMNLLPDQELQLFGFVREGDRRVRADSMGATIQPSDRGHVPFPVELNDDGRDGDAAAGDLLYTGSFRLPAGQDDTFKGAHTVQGLAAVGSDRIANSAGFLYSLPRSKLTGRFRDALVDRNLVVYAQVEVWEEARFHVEATVYGGDPLQAIGWAQNAAVLPRGVHEIPVEFYGLMFAKAGIDGPYLLRYASLRTTQGMPNDLSELLVDAYRTAAYRASDFTDQSYADADAAAPALPGAP